jgi:hypothetical protein
MTTTIITTTTITVASMFLLTAHPSLVVGHLDNQLKGRSPAKLGPRPNDSHFYFRRFSRALLALSVPLSESLVPCEPRYGRGSGRCTEAPGAQLVV